MPESGEFKSLPLKLAYDFLSGKGFKTEAEEIRFSKDTYKSYDTSLKRGKIVLLLDKNGLMAEFITTCWPFGNTEKGKKKIRRYKGILDGFMNQDLDKEEQEEEDIEGTSFAYEEDLRNYLADNLAVVELGLRLFEEEKDRDGIEYQVDDSGKRIDILAIDKDGTPVVIELKVSSGYEKVIGQCLYYRNRVKELLKAKRVRIVIVAREINDRLKIAAEGLPDVELFEYELSVKLRRGN